jgi:hypothetical protein
VASALLSLVVAGYAAVATAYLEARRRTEEPPRWARTAGILTVAAHLLGLWALGQELGASPFRSGSHSVSFLAFSLGAFYLVLEATSRVAVHGGGFWLAVALLAAGGVPGISDRKPEGVPAPARDAVGTVHIGLGLLGLAAVLAGGLLAIGYLSTYRKVKRKVLVAGATGPSLSGFERLERRAALLGLLLLGPAMVLGVRAALVTGATAGTSFLAVVTAVLFLLVAAAGFLWWRRPLFGRLAAWLNVSGAALAFLAFAVVHPIVLARS